MNTTNTTFSPILAGDVWELAETILRAQGRQRFFTDWDKELTTPLVSCAIPEAGALLTPKPGRPEMRVQVTRLSARRSRRLDYTRLHRERADLYSRFVTETTPPIPLRLTFRAATVMAKSEEWDTIRSEAWAEVHAQLGEQRAASHELRNAADIGAALREVRDRRKVDRTAEEKARGDLAAEIMASAAEGTVFQRAGDGRLYTPVAPPKRSANLDEVEAHPLAQRYIRTSTVRESVRVWFQAEGHDPESDQDPFEGD